LILALVATLGTAGFIALRKKTLKNIKKKGQPLISDTDLVAFLHGQLQKVTAQAADLQSRLDASKAHLVAAQRAAAEDEERAKQLEEQNLKADQVFNDLKLTNDRELTAINTRLHALEEDLKKRDVHLALVKNNNAQLQREIEDLRGTLEMTKRTATQKADEAARLQQEQQHTVQELDALKRSLGEKEDIIRKEGEKAQRLADDLSSLRKAKDKLNLELRQVFDECKTKDYGLHKLASEIKSPREEKDGVDFKLQQFQEENSVKHNGLCDASKAEGELEPVVQSLQEANTYPVIQPSEPIHSASSNTNRVSVPPSLSWGARTKRASLKWVIRAGIVQRGPYTEDKVLLPLMLPFVDPFYSTLPTSVPKPCDGDGDEGKHTCDKCELAYTKKDYYDHYDACCAFFNDHAIICKFCHKIFLDNSGYRREHESNCALKPKAHQDVLNKLAFIPSYNIVSQLPSSASPTMVMQLKADTRSDVNTNIVLVRAILPFQDSDYGTCNLPKPCEVKPPPNWSRDEFESKKRCWHCKKWYQVGKYWHQHLDACRLFFSGNAKFPRHVYCRGCDDIFQQNSAFDQHQRLCMEIPPAVVEDTERFRPSSQHGAWQNLDHHSSPYTTYPEASQYGRLQSGVLPAQQPSPHGYSAPRQWPPHTPRRK
tara:strand:- start:6843 stop:8804 length:1962 start_codon:yes stop_codon:yes gene_type:complete